MSAWLDHLIAAVTACHRRLQLDNDVITREVPAVVVHMRICDEENDKRPD